MSHDTTGIEILPSHICARSANEHHAIVQKAAGEVTLHAVAAGEQLNCAKGMVPHGNWQSWLLENFDGSIRTAQTYMRLARVLPETPTHDMAQTPRIASIRAALRDLSEALMPLPEESATDRINELAEIGQSPGQRLSTEQRALIAQVASEARGDGGAPAGETQQAEQTEQDEQAETEQAETEQAETEQAETEQAGEEPVVSLDTEALSEQFGIDVQTLEEARSEGILDPPLPPRPPSANEMMARRWEAGVKRKHREQKIIVARMLTKRVAIKSLTGDIFDLEKATHFQGTPCEMGRIPDDDLDTLTELARLLAIAAKILGETLHQAGVGPNPEKYLRPDD